MANRESHTVCAQGMISVVHQIFDLCEGGVIKLPPRIRLTSSAVGDNVNSTGKTIILHFEEVSDVH